MKMAKLEVPFSSILFYVGLVAEDKHIACPAQRSCEHSGNFEEGKAITWGT